MSNQIPFIKNKIAIVESPFSPPKEFNNKSLTNEERQKFLAENIAYAQFACNYLIKQGYSPFASHLLYTQPNILNDDIPEERNLGIQAGFTFSQFADNVFVFYDYGISEGMIEGIKNASRKNKQVHFISLEKLGYELNKNRLSEENQKVIENLTSQILLRDEVKIEKQKPAVLSFR